MRNQAIMVQNNYASSENIADQNQEQHDNMEVTLLNWQSSKFYGMNGQDKKKSSVSANTRLKKRAMDSRQQARNSQ